MWQTTGHEMYQYFSLWMINLKHDWVRNELVTTMKCKGINLEGWAYKQIKIIVHSLILGHPTESMQWPSFKAKSWMTIF